jgi:hypothetical protein
LVVGKINGLEYLVPKPEPDHGYADIVGVPVPQMAIAEPLGLNATAYLTPAGKAAGSEYLVPNPLPDHGYENTYGFVSVATAMSDPDNVNATPLTVPAGGEAGLEYFTPKPPALVHGYTNRPPAPPVAIARDAVAAAT